MTKYFKCVLSNVDASALKFQEELGKTILPSKTESEFILKVDEVYTETNNQINKIKNTQTKLNDIIASLEVFRENLNNSYNNNLIKFDALINDLVTGKYLYDKAKFDYFLFSNQQKKEEQRSNIFSGYTEEILLEEESNAKIKAKISNSEMIYKYELEKYNLLLEKQNKIYNEIKNDTKQTEESRVFFVRQSIEKFNNYLEEFYKTFVELINKIKLSVSKEICEEEVKKIRDGESFFKNEGERLKKENFIPFTKERFEEIKKEIETSEKIIIKHEINEDESNRIISEVYNQLLQENEIKAELIADLIEMIQENDTFKKDSKENQTISFSKKFLNYILEKKKTFSISLSNIQNLYHLSNIFCFISLKNDSVLEGNFEINFKIIFLSERIYYKNKANNTKIYLCALISRNKYYRSKFFWRNLIELKLANILQEHIARLKKIKLPEEKNSSFFRRLGSKLSSNKEIKNDSVVFTNKVSKLIKNLDELDASKIPLLDKIASNEVGKIIRECIPSFANFNFPSEEALDLIAEIANQYKTNKAAINFYVTYFNVSLHTIRNKLLSESNIFLQRPKTSEKDTNTFIIYSLKYLDKTDYINLMLLSKKSYKKLSKRIYKILLSNNVNNFKFRVQVWKNLLQISEIKKKYNYEEELKRAKEIIKTNEIKMDVVRTFVSDQKRVEEIRGKILNVLQAISINNGEVKYCQGMNYIAEFIFEITQSEEDTFYIFLGFFLKTEYPLIFEKDLSKLKIFFYVFKRLVSLLEPELYSYFNSNNVDVNFFVPPWFITLFLSARQFSKEKEAPIVLVRIIDNFLISGWKSLIKIGIEALHSTENELMKLKHEETLQYLINDMLKIEFFTSNDIERIEKCINDDKIQKKLIKNIESEYLQEAKLKKIENNSSLE